MADVYTFEERIRLKIPGEDPAAAFELVLPDSIGSFSESLDSSSIEFWFGLSAVKTIILFYFKMVVRGGDDIRIMISRSVRNGCSWRAGHHVFNNFLLHLQYVIIQITHRTVGSR